MKTSVNVKKIRKWMFFFAIYGIKEIRQPNKAFLHNEVASFLCSLFWHIKKIEITAYHYEHLLKQF